MKGFHNNTKTNVAIIAKTEETILFYFIVFIILMEVEEKVMRTGPETPARIKGWMEGYK